VSILARSPPVWGRWWLLASARCVSCWLRKPDACEGPEESDCVMFPFRRSPAAAAVVPVYRNHAWRARAKPLGSPVARGPYFLRAC